MNEFDMPESHTFRKRPFTQYATTCTFPLYQYIELLGKVSRNEKIIIPLFNPDESLRRTFNNKDVYLFKTQLKKSTNGTNQHYLVVDFSDVPGIS